MTAREPSVDGRRITHAHAKLLFSKAWDGEADGEELQALREHLRGCSKCVQATAQMREFVEKLDDLLYDG